MTRRSIKLHTTWYQQILNDTYYGVLEVEESVENRDSGEMLFNIFSVEAFWQDDQ